VYRCAACFRKTETFQPSEPAGEPGKVCVRCGRDVSTEVGPNRHGAFVCAACKADPERIVRQLLELASAGNPDLLAVQDYTILQELGKGGMGAVYLARHARTGEEVALKVMLPRVALDERAREMFLRETVNTRALKHPHVVELRDAGCWQGIFFFTLEFCDRGSVSQRMKDGGGTLPIDEAGAILLQVLDGLDYAHNADIPHVQRADGSIGRGRGLVHRDLKPGNIFLATAGGGRVAKVGDYGLAKAFRFKRAVGRS
jgi:serine/threonine protein kinase